METRKIENQFREDEIALIKRYDKQRNEWITNVYPKIGGRLRLAHEENEALSIETDVIKYDENIAVVCAISTTAKGCFKGIGMASTERDQKIAPAILELAETRAIARSLRFAGYGVEYCSAEEVSHLENGNGDKVPNGGRRHQNGDNLPAGGKRNDGNSNNRPYRSDGNGNGHGNGSSRYQGKAKGNGNGNGRLTGKQYRYLLKLHENQGRTKADLDQQCLEMFGVVAQYLSKGDASVMIEQLLAQ